MKNKKVLFNIPNCLCFFRILLIPLFLYVYFVADFKNRYLVAAFVLVISDFGKFIDPVADKLTQFVVAITLLFSYPLAWVLLIIIILKDLMLAIVGLYLYDYGLKITGASWWGKIATAYFYVIVIVLIGLHIPNTVISFVLIITGSVLMLLSFILYAKELRYMVKEKDKLLNEQKNG